MGSFRYCWYCCCCPNCRCLDYPCLNCRCLGCHCLHWQRSTWTRTKPDSRVWLRVWIVWQACCWLGPLIPATCRNAFLLRNIQSNTGLEIVYTQCNAGQTKNSENLLYMVVFRSPAQVSSTKYGSSIAKQKPTFQANRTQNTLPSEPLALSKTT